MKNVDYHSSNLHLEELGPSPEKSRTAQLMDGDSDTDFADAIESGVDEDYKAPNLVAANLQVQLDKERREVGKGGPVSTQIRKGMAKKPLEFLRSSENALSGKKLATAQKNTTLSRAVCTDSSIYPAMLDDSKSSE